MSERIKKVWTYPIVMQQAAFTCGVEHLALLHEIPRGLDDYRKVAHNFSHTRCRAKGLEHDTASEGEHHGDVDARGDQDGQERALGDGGLGVLGVVEYEERLGDD